MEMQRCIESLMNAMVGTRADIAVDIISGLRQTSRFEKEKVFKIYMRFGMAITRRPDTSISGWILKVQIGPITWSSKKQSKR